MEPRARWREQKVCSRLGAADRPCSRTFCSRQKAVQGIMHAGSRWRLADRLLRGV